MKKCLVLGGGFAGLSTAAYLLSSNHSVELIESSPKLGGRAYSLADETGSCEIDNGQHIMMGCYKETINFLKLIGADKNFLIQDKLKINFLKEHQNIIPLEADKYLYPFNLAAALLKYKALSVRERFQLLKLFLELPLIPEKDLERMTVHEWLVKNNQNKNIRSSFWDILAIGALNTGTKQASAQMFLRIIKEIFFRGNKSAVIIIPSKGLTEAYCSDASAYIESKGGIISRGETVIGSTGNGKRITEVKTSKRAIRDFDYIISAVPHYSFIKIFPDVLPDIEYEYSSILSIHIWLNRNPLKHDFYGLIDSQLHWIFNHGTHITLVVSNADHFISEPKEQLFEILLKELNKFTGVSRGDITRYKVIKEKRATFIPSNSIEKLRPGTETKYQNLFIAGDWVNTRLPSTIESAVRSAGMAVEAVNFRN